MIGPASEMTDKLSFGWRDHHLHPCPRMKQVGQSALLWGTSWGYEPTMQRNAMHNVKLDTVPLDYSPGLYVLNLLLYVQLSPKFWLKRMNLTINAWKNA